MLADLRQLIRLQTVENSISETKSKIASLPLRLEKLDTRVNERETVVANAKLELDQHKRDRAGLEKTVSEIQGRLSRFKEQLMSVKTNKEYHAMQTEITTAEQDLQGLEDKLLERMLEADDLSDEVKKTQDLLTLEQSSANDEREEIEREQAILEQELGSFETDRIGVIDQLTPTSRSLFETLTRGRNGVAVAEVQSGHCTCCQVRLRPQLVNDIRSNEKLFQCESCQRILYFSEHHHLARE